MQSPKICNFNQQDIKTQSHHLGTGKAALLLATKSGSHILVPGGAHHFPFDSYRHRAGYTSVQVSRVLALKCSGKIQPLKKKKKGRKRKQQQQPRTTLCWEHLWTPRPSFTKQETPLLFGTEAPNSVATRVYLLGEKRCLSPITRLLPVPGFFPNLQLKSSEPKMDRHTKSTLRLSELEAFPPTLFSQ